ncbi:MAG: tubulin/FtsZ family protein [Dehalogenimonas sp.]
MKILAIGIGQCGCNIADEFYAINDYSKSFFGRKIEILTEAFAINSDETDLTSLRYIPRDRNHRIVMGMTKTFGHGVGKINTEGTKLMKEITPVVIDDVLNSPKYHESDAIVVIASGAGGTGSGSIGYLVKELKDRIEKPVYAIVVLPFAYEEKAEISYAVMNTATCVNTVNQYADAVFLLDNERFGRGGTSLEDNLRMVNQQMVKNFFDLFCAGEEHSRTFIGSKVIDSGDIMHSLKGITTIGRGEIALPTFHSLSRNDFREASKASSSLVGAYQQAVNNLSLRIKTEDARTGLAIICAPKDVITMSAMAEINNSLQERAPKAVFRMGDYPRRGKEVSVSLILSTITASDRMSSLFFRAEDLIKKKKALDEETSERIERLYGLSSGLPMLE